jgi:ubiquinone/menaquinone biosynthesis C-methylase UbiE
MEEQKQRQVQYHELEHYRRSTPRQPDNSNPLVAWLNNYRLQKMMEMIRTSLAGKSVLSLCGGDGEEADFLQRLGAKVTMIDLSPIAVEAARFRNPALDCRCMDAERLDFADGSFDWAIVREGLHHLARPVEGLYELERVSREGFAFMEGQDSVMVRLLTKIGIAEDCDPAGGYVYRFSRREIQKIFASLQIIGEYRIHTAWLPFGNDVLKYFPMFGRFVYPVINLPFIRRVLISKPARHLLKCIFASLNRLIGRWGNCLIVVARKEPISPVLGGIGDRAR